MPERQRHHHEESGAHAMRGSAWFFTAMDDATEAKLAAIVSRTAG